MDILDPHRVLRFFGKVWEETLEVSDGAVKDLVLLFGTTLHLCDYIIHISVYMGKDVPGVWQDHPCFGDLGDGAITRNQERLFDNGVGNICQRL